MSEHNPSPANHAEEDEVRLMLARAGFGGSMTEVERDRVTLAMWDEFGGDDTATIDQLALLGEPPNRAVRNVEPVAVSSEAPSRFLLWAAIVLIAVGLTAAVALNNTRLASPAVVPSPDRTTVQVGDRSLEFDSLPGYQVNRRSPASVELTASGQSLREHAHITVVQAATLFGGQDPDRFFGDADLQPESVLSTDESSGWLVQVPLSPGCLEDPGCLHIADLVDGQPLNLTPNTFVRIDIYEQGRGGPIVVVSEIASNVTAPALDNLEISGN